MYVLILILYINILILSMNIPISYTNIIVLSHLIVNIYKSIDYFVHSYT